MAGLRTILIHTSDIIPGTKKMKDKLGRLDLLGQILFTGYKVRIIEHSTSPADQGTVIHPFSVYVRGRAHNTELTLKLLRNAETLSGRKQVEEANKLLEEYDIYLELA
jgi:hypothetical protein